MASARENISESVASPLKAFTPQRMKRQFSAVYPFAGSMRSMDGENIFGPGTPGSAMLNGKSVIAHRPVHVSRPQSKVRENGTPFFLARALAELIRCTHG